MICQLRLLHIFILTVAFVACSTATCAAIMSMTLYFKKISMNLNEFGNYLPHHYVINSSYDTLVPNAGSEQYSALFSVVSLLESEYRNQMYLKNELNRTDTIEFSKLAFSTAIYDACKDPKYIKICENIQNPFTVEDLTVTQLLKLISSIPDLSGALLPEGICSDNSKNCTNALEYKRNPLRFKLKNLNFATEIHAIKELIYSTMKPVLFQMPQLMAEYYIPCSDKRANGTIECQSKTFDCPNNPDEKCGILQFPANTYSGEFFVPLDPVGKGTAENLNFEIVGFSDSFVASRGRMSLKHMKTSKGGFIAKGVVRDIGFPITYYSGDLKKSNSHNICPNIYASHFWYGPLRSCMKSATDINRCSSQASDDDDSETSFEFADQLICVNDKYCDENEKYTILHLPSRTYDTIVYEESTGMTSTPMIKLSNPIKDVVIDSIPFYRLGDAFEMYYPTKSDQQCGYWFIPYDVIDTLHAISRDQQTLAMNFDIEFTPSSFLSKMPEGIVKKHMKKVKMPQRKISTHF